MRMNFIVYLVLNLHTASCYVGKTSVRVGALKRFQKHVYHSNRNPTTHFHHAIKLYGKQNFFAVTLTEYATESDAYAGETVWIRTLRELGCHLYNENDGGQGGVVPSEELREKLRNAQALCRERKILAIKEALAKPEEKHRRAEAARTATSESWKDPKVRQRMIDAMNQKDSIEKRSAAQKGNLHGAKITEETAINILSDFKFGMSKSALVEKYNVKYSTVRFLVDGTTWKHLQR